MTEPAPSPALSIRIRGQVQGVGFRPFVWRLARARGLGGEVLNDAEGVLIHAEGPDLPGFLDAVEPRSAGAGSGSAAAGAGQPHNDGDRGEGEREGCRDASRRTPNVSWSPAGVSWRAAATSPLMHCRDLW